MLPSSWTSTPPPASSRRAPCGPDSRAALARVSASSAVGASASSAPCALRLEEARAAGDRAALEHELDAGLREVDRIAQTVDELLVLSRTGERDAPGEVLDLAEAAGAAGRRWAATAAAHDLELQVEAAAATDPVWCARADLDRALDAVIENAILYGAGGRHVTIRAGGRTIEVLDEGAGLAPGEEQALFDRFRRGSAGAGAPNGTGLGLAIARELMRCWNGDAALANRDAQARARR